MQLSHHIKARSIVLLLLTSTFLIFYQVHVVFPQGSSNTVVRIEASSGTVRPGETLNVTITVANVQNLYGLGVIFRWNASALSALNVDVRLGVESHPGGVLHDQVYVAENTITQELGEYHLAASSIGPASPFSGSGNLAIITFNVTSLGNSELDLETQLYDYPPPERQPRETLPIQHTDLNGFVNIIPEFPSVAILTLCVVLLTIMVALSKKLAKSQLLSTGMRA